MWKVELHGGRPRGDQVESVEEDTVVVAVVANEIERGNAVVIAGDSFAIDDI